MTSRLLVAAGLLAVVTACKSPPAGDGVRPDEPTTAAVETAADAGAAPAEGTDGQDPAAPPAVPPLVQELPLLGRRSHRVDVDGCLFRCRRNNSALFFYIAGRLAHLIGPCPHIVCVTGNIGNSRFNFMLQFVG